METDNTPIDKGRQQSENPPAANVGLRKDSEESVIAAHEQAEADMEQDPDLNSEPDPAADLDEGEIARLDNDNDKNAPI